MTVNFTMLSVAHAKSNGNARKVALVFCLHVGLPFRRASVSFLSSFLDHHFQAHKPHWLFRNWQVKPRIPSDSTERLWQLFSRQRRPGAENNWTGGNGTARQSDIHCCRKRNLQQRFRSLEPQQNKSNSFGLESSGVD